MLSGARLTAPPFRPPIIGQRRLAGRLGDRGVATIIKCAAAGLEPRQFAGHSLRAGFATQAAADDADTLAIREVTGHKSDAMLARYVRSGGAQARAAVRRALEGRG